MAMENVRRIRRLRWPGLLALWRNIYARATPGWQPGKALEHLILRAFELDGAEVVWPFDVRMEGQTIEQIDGVVHFDGLSFLVECKDFAGNVNIEPVAKMRNQLMRRHSGAFGVVFVSSEFTMPAIILARFSAPQAVLLWTGGEIEHAISQRRMKPFLIKKYRYFVEQGMPDFDIRV